MADNTTLNTGSGGDVIATDDVGGVKYQRVKLDLGGDGAADPAAGDSTDGLLVNLGANNDVSVTGTVTVDLGANNDVTVTSGAITETNSTAILASTANIDTNLATVAGDTTSLDSKVTACDTGAVVISSGSMTVDLGANNDVTVTSGAITETNSAAILADTASIDTNMATVAGAVTGTEMQVDVVTSALPTGAATAAAQLPDGHNVTVDNAAGASAVNIQDGGNSITIDGTVTANAGTGTMTVDLGANNDVTVTSGAITETNSGAILADTASMDTNLATIAGAVSTQMQVDVVAALPAGTNAIGKLAANTGVDIGDVNVTSQPARDRGTDNVGAALDTDTIMQDTTARTVAFASIDAAASPDNTIIAAQGAGNKIRVLAYTIVAAGAVNVRWESGTGGTALSGQMNLTTNSGISAAYCPHGHFETAANALLNLELSSAVSVDGHLTYVVVT